MHEAPSSLAIAAGCMLQPLATIRAAAPSTLPKPAVMASALTGLSAEQVEFFVANNFVRVRDATALQRCCGRRAVPAVVANWPHCF